MRIPHIRIKTIGKLAYTFQVQSKNSTKETFATLKQYPSVIMKML